MSDYENPRPLAGSILAHNMNAKLSPPPEEHLYITDAKWFMTFQTPIRAQLSHV